jgi:flagellar biosynthesis activator protein FlaF
MSSAAYARVAEQVSSPRELEARALLTAAKRFKAIQANWSPRHADLFPALRFNRRLWTIFVAAAVGDDCPHSKDVRQGIASIGVFVLDRTLQTEINPAREKLDALIDINLNIAAGLGSAA